MKIGIDCRLYGPKHTGLGRYTQNLVENLLKIDKENEYALFVKDEKTEEIGNLKIKYSFHPPNRRIKFQIIAVDIPHYSLKEQTLFPSVINKEKVDLMHFTHFNVPVFYHGKYVVTIHDLIKHFSKGASTTTKNPLIYRLKYLGYKFVFGQAIKRAEKIIVPSQFVMEELIKQYKIAKNKIVVTYEGVDKNKKPGDNAILKKYKITKPYLLYVGNVYPHKNIEKLIEAIKILNQPLITNHQSLITLVVVCARNVFSERLKKIITQSGAESFVKMAGYVPDDELAVLFWEAEAFVFPTLSEGFGLPGLEAMALGCPVICSDIPVLREVYQEAALYFDPVNPADIAEKIKLFLSDKTLQEKLKNLGSELAGKYSWSRMAKETLSVYQSV